MTKPAPAKPVSAEEANLIARARYRQMVNESKPEEGEPGQKADIVKQQSDALRADVLTIDSLLPVDGQSKPRSLFALMALKDRVEEMSSALSFLIERHKFNIGKDCMDRDEPLGGISDPDLTIKVEPAIRFSVNPQMWDSVPKNLLQKRLLESVVAKGFASNDRMIVDMVGRDVLRQTPYINVMVRRKPGRAGASSNSNESQQEE